MGGLEEARDWELVKGDSNTGTRLTTHTVGLLISRDGAQQAEGTRGAPGSSSDGGSGESRGRSNGGDDSAS